MRVFTSHLAPVFTDELFHVLAGQAMAQGRGTALIDGHYDRGWLYTAAVAGLYRMDGMNGMGSVALARLPALLAGAVCPALLFLLVDRTAGRAAAIIAAALLTLDALSVEYSQFARFYTAQQLCVLGMVLVGHDALHRPLRQAVPRGLGALVLAILAIHFQVTSVVVVAAFAGFVMGEVLLRPSVRAWLWQKQRRWWVVTALILMLVVGLASVVALWPMLQTSDGWAEANRSNLRFYFDALLASWPVLWPLTGFLTLAALWCWPRVTILCVLLFATTFVVQSLGSMKTARYLLHVLPFLFALWAMGSVVALRALAAALRIMAERIHAERGTQDVATAPFTMAGFVISGLFISGLAISAMAILLPNPALATTLAATLRSVGPVLHNPAILLAEPDDPPWSTGSDALRATVPHDALLVSADVMRTARHLRAPQLSFRSDGDPPGSFFPVDQRTGLPRVGRPDSLELLIRCTRHGAILVPQSKWRTFAVSDAAAQTVERLTMRLPAPPGFRLYRWSHAPARMPGCATVTQALGK
ncbi:glycosyltransferase family 39 protein [Croceicoccus sp. F390]|uniref:Glycosyltransferase family 39 protein n=1 Tax=Croceicoccus esteveae TaxID=3075597 RepID=A0ABU2ZLR8_9SPHN|nr:glycosyltransferase family 39 protein [Croceicoccus sp. F390]MDT0576978.1 glycosyltransferase family 39 protein [Croceicoccus sp. F390]